MATPIDVDRNNEARAPEATAPEHLAIHASPEIAACAEAAHKAFLKSIETAIANEFSVKVETQFTGTEQSFMSRYDSRDDNAFLDLVMEIEPGIGCAVLRFSSGLLYRVLNLLLAGPADAADERGGLLTEIELHLLRKFFQLLANELRTAWGAVPDVRFTPAGERSEMLRQLHRDVNVLALRSTLQIDDAEGTLDVVVPGFLARRAASRGSLTENSALRIPNAVAVAKVELEAVLSTMTICLGDLVDLAPGQILLAERVSDSKFECLVNKQKQFTGELASVGDHYGFQLTGAAGSKE